jgi:hypothetical protein
MNCHRTIVQLPYLRPGSWSANGLIRYAPDAGEWVTAKSLWNW